jgi:hypothetical protein
LTITASFTVGIRLQLPAEVQLAARFQVAPTEVQVRAKAVSLASTSETPSNAKIHRLIGGLSAAHAAGGRDGVI